MVISDTVWRNHQQYMESHSETGCQLSVPAGGAILSTGMPGISAFGLPVVISDTLWKRHQQYWESYLIQDVNYLYLVKGHPLYWHAWQLFCQQQAFFCRSCSLAVPEKAPQQAVGRAFARA